jgi:hypothetical protein
MVQLDTLLATAAWRAIVMHATNADPTITGTDLLTVLVQSHTDLAPAGGASAASAITTPAASASGGVTSASYGSVRDTALGDALRLDEARDALAEIQKTSQVCLRLLIHMLSDGAPVSLGPCQSSCAWGHCAPASLSDHPHCHVLN